jgi:ethanolamine ammonia-lyase small subunit
LPWRLIESFELAKRQRLPKVSPMRAEKSHFAISAAPSLLGLSLAPVVIATGARVALGDEVGALLNARAIAVLIGERPGRSSPDSLGVYLT